MAVHPFSALRPVEDRLWRAVARAGETLERIVSIDAAVATDGSVRAEFLAWLLVVDAPRTAPNLAQLGLIRARVDGSLDLAGLRLTLTPRLSGCSLPRGVVLRDATVVGFEILGGMVASIDGDRLTASGSFVIRTPSDRDMLGMPEEIRRPPTLLRQLRLSGASIRGNLDLRGCQILAQYAPDGVALFADGLKVDGNALLGDGFMAAGEVRVSGGRFERNLDLSGAELRAQTVYSFSAIGAHVMGSLYLCHTWAVQQQSRPRGFSAFGTVQLAGAQIDGEFSCIGGRFTAPDFCVPPLGAGAGDAARSIRANGMRVGGALRLRDGFWSRGSVHLVNAHVGGDLQCHGAFFDYPGDSALDADGIAVGGTTFFDRETRSRLPEPPAVPVPSRTNGFIALRYADFAQGIYVEHVRFESLQPAVPAPAPPLAGPPRANCGMLAAFARIHGSLSFLEIVCQPATLAPGTGIGIDLRQAKADEVEDDPASWSGVTVLNVTGFEYNAIRGLRSEDYRWRCHVLDEHYAGKRRESAQDRAKRFERQPYRQLAKVMQQAGYGEAAKKVRIRLEQAQTRAGNYGFLMRSWRYSQEFTTAYGYNFLLLLWPLVAWVVLAGWLFAGAPIGPNGQIVDTKAKAGAPALVPASDYEEFHTYVHAFEMVASISGVDLHQKGRFEVKPPDWSRAWRETGYGAAGFVPHVWNAFIRYLVPVFGYATPFIGWLLGGLFAVGITGRLRQGDSGGDG
jgi:hypothetical protein